MALFEACFAVVVGEEGGLSTDRADPGNWTGGRVGAGQLVGTKYGIAASAFPNIDIPNLTLSQAQAIYQKLYWSRVSGDLLPGPLALLTFDAAVNNGVKSAVTWLQAAASAAPDGVLGPDTLAAVAVHVAANLDGLCSEFLAQRLVYMAGLSTWRTFGVGWARRLCALPYRAASLSAPAKAA
jgi:lysozyme family protein